MTNIIIQVHRSNDQIVQESLMNNSLRPSLEMQAINESGNGENVQSREEEIIAQDCRNMDDKGKIKDKNQTVN